MGLESVVAALVKRAASQICSFGHAPVGDMGSLLPGLLTVFQGHKGDAPFMDFGGPHCGGPESVVVAR